MIRIITISFFLFIGICKTRAQDVFSISEAEAKSADKKIHFKANTNTSNYDITYHKLEFSVDPTEYDRKRCYRKRKRINLLSKH